MTITDAEFLRIIADVLYTHSCVVLDAEYDGGKGNEIGSDFGAAERLREIAQREELADRQYARGATAQESERTYRHHGAPKA